MIRMTDISQLVYSIPCRYGAHDPFMSELNVTDLSAAWLDDLRKICRCQKDYAKAMSLQRYGVHDRMRVKASLKT